MNIAPVEQVAAELLAGIIIPEGQGGNAANITKRAQTALAFGTALQSIAGGDASTGVAAISAALANASLDPAVVLALQNLVTLGLQQVSILSSINNAVPLFGSTASAVLKNVATGLVAAANAEISKYAAAANQTGT